MVVYKEVKKDLSDKITTGIYKPGDRIPSERNLSEVYGISRMTLRQALNALEKDGLIRREKGRGTFVTSKDLFQENLRSFTHTLIARQIEPSSKIIEVSKVLHLKQISQLLQINQGEAYYKIKRLRCGDGVPMGLETVYIPVIRVPDIDQYDLTQSFYGILENYYGYEMTRSACEIEACLANSVLATQMVAKKNSALLKVSGVTYSQGDQPLFYEESYYRSELYKYHVDIMG